MLGNLIGAGIVIAAYGLKTFMALGELNTAAPHFMASIWILQTAGTTLPILIAPLFFARMVVNDVADYIKPAPRFSLGMLLLIFAVMFVSMPLIEFLSNLNQKLPLPEWLKWMKQNQDANEKVMTEMLKMTGVWDVIAKVLFIGLLTAIAEEFMFRGVLQTIFFRWTKNIHVAIWITAILFSAFHMEYFGFFPRLLLGLFFGYFVAWSRSIWTGIWAHFINNGTIVIVTYLFQQKIIKGDINDQHVFNYAAYIFSFAVTAGLVFIYRKIAALRSTTAMD
ncbi:MAG TPA: CPBP family intramembrane glutamic endopeptidase [Mucilaginibacter sp.]|nr:CPBP family intramembrane glutamic endopeptidase [Mucilaginibacter sp.]